MKNAFLMGLGLLLSFQFTLAQEFQENDEAGLHKTRLSLKHSFDTLYKRNEHPDLSEDQALKQTDVSISVPVYQTEDFSVSIFGKDQEYHFAGLPPNSLTTANDFYDQQYGFKMSYREDQDNMWHLSTAYGSASDKPFESGDVSTFSVTLLSKHTISATSSWTFFMNYSNNRTFLNNVPLPGAAYSFSDENHTQGWILGFPFCMYWARPAEKISTSVFFLFPSGLRASVGYMFSPPFQVNLKATYGQDVFIPANRTDHDVRLFYETKKIAAGLKAFLGRENFLEWELGRTFSRSMFGGESSFKLTTDRLSLEDEWQMSLALQAGF